MGFIQKDTYPEISLITFSLQLLESESIIH